MDSNSPTAYADAAARPASTPNAPATGVATAATPAQSAASATSAPTGLPPTVPEYVAHFSERALSPTTTNKFKSHLISEAAAQVIGPKQVLGAQLIQNYWYVYCRTEKSLNTLLIEGLDVGEKHISFSPKPQERLNRRRATEKIIIRDVPLTVENDIILSALAEHSHSFTSEVFYAHDRCEDGSWSPYKNGDRYIYAESPILPLIPRRISIAGYTARVFHPSQFDMCKYCKTVAHKTLSDLCPARANPDHHVIPFKGHNNVLSNFYKCEKGCLIEYDGQTFETAEHAYQWAKASFYGDTETAEKIFIATTAFDAKLLGSTVQGDDAQNKEWDMQRPTIMHQVVRRKFETCFHSQETLDDTKSATLVEATSDKYWASGLNPATTASVAEKFWPGTNALGAILMSVRDSLVCRRPDPSTQAEDPALPLQARPQDISDDNPPPVEEDTKQNRSRKDKHNESKAQPKIDVMLAGSQRPSSVARPSSKRRRSTEDPASPLAKSKTKKPP